MKDIINITDQEIELSYCIITVFGKR